jgi:hypothetical protein
LDGQEIAHRRMQTQRLWGAPLGGPEAVVRWLAAMQSQEFAVAKWSVAQRTDGADHAAVARAFADGAILRTHVLRPTWHFVLPEDIRWLLALTGPRVQALNRYYYRQAGLDDRLLARSNDRLARALEGGRHLVRTELAAALARDGIAVSGLALGYVLMRAELDAVLCSGAPRGKQQTYALFDERVPPATTRAGDEALAELVGRYFAAHGPATLKDFLWWSSLTATDARRGLDMVGSALESRRVDGRTYWLGPAAPPARPASPRIDLVQGYDETIVAYTESRDVLGVPGGVPVAAGDRPLFLHAILLDGRLIGHWRHAPRRRSIAVETALHRPLDAAEARALDDALERYRRFWGGAAVPPR